MRTTLTIDDDLLLRAQEVAKHQRRPVGAIVSDLMRKGLEERSSSTRTKRGIVLLPDRPGTVVTNEMIRQLRDEEGI